MTTPTPAQTPLSSRYERYRALTLRQHGPILEIIMGAAQSANQKLATADAICTANSPRSGATYRPTRTCA